MSEIRTSASGKRLEMNTTRWSHRYVRLTLSEDCWLELRRISAPYPPITILFATTFGSLILAALPLDGHLTVANILSI
jgi:hypothetical protein